MTAVKDLSDHTQYYVKLSKKFWKLYFESNTAVNTAKIHKFSDAVTNDFDILCDMVRAKGKGGYIKYIKFVEQYEDTGMAHIIDPDGMDHEISFDGSFMFFATSKTSNLGGVVTRLKKYAKIKNTDEPVVVAPFMHNAKSSEVKYDGEKYVELDTNTYEYINKLSESGKNWSDHVEQVEKNGWNIPVRDKDTAKHFGLAKYSTFLINEKFLEQDK